MITKITAKTLVKCSRKIKTKSIQELQKIRKPMFEQRISHNQNKEFMWKDHSKN